MKNLALLSFLALACGAAADLDATLLTPGALPDALYVYVVDPDLADACEAAAGQWEPVAQVICTPNPAAYRRLSWGPCEDEHWGCKYNDGSGQIHVDPTKTDMINPACLPTVVAHEIGHALGLEHQPEGLMRVSNPCGTEVQDSDMTALIKQQVARHKLEGRL